MSRARRVSLVIRREWDQRVRSTAFRISTLVSAAIVVAIVAIPQIYGGGVKRPSVVGVVARPRRSCRTPCGPQEGRSPAP